MSKEKNKEMVLAFFEAFRTRDRDTIDRLLSDSGAYWIIGDAPYSGELVKSAFIGNIEQLWAVTEDPLQLDIQYMTCEDDRVSTALVGHMPTKSGQVYRNTYHVLSFVEGDRIVGWREYFDTDAANLVFGL